MEAIELLPCRIRDDVVIPIKDESSFTLSWNQAIEQLIPKIERDHNDQSGKINLRFARIGDYVGVRNKSFRGRVVPTSFIISSRGAGNDLGWLLKRHPDFPKTVETIYRVESVRWQSKIVTESAA